VQGRDCLGWPPGVLAKIDARLGQGSVPGATGAPAIKCTSEFNRICASAAKRQEPVLPTPLGGFSSGGQRGADGALRPVLLDETAERRLLGGADGGGRETKNLEVRQSTPCAPSNASGLHTFMLFISVRADRV
jgi:hypothetical protein